MMYLEFPKHNEHKTNKNPQPVKAHSLTKIIYLLLIFKVGHYKTYVGICQSNKDERSMILYVTQVK